MGAIFNEKVYVDYLPVDENHPCRPDEAYGLSKLFVTVAPQLPEICLYQFKYRICEQQADAICLRFPSMRIASLRPHWCILDTDPLPASILPDAPTKFQTTVFADVPQMPDKDASRQLWGWNTYKSIARACYLAICDESHGWERGHEAFFIVSSKLGSNRTAKELVAEWFPEVTVKAELRDDAGLYDCSKAARLLGWSHDE